MLQVGVYRSDVNPPLDLPHAGWGAQTHVWAEGCEGDLTVAALYLTDGSREAMVLDFDLGVIYPPEVGGIREGVAEATGVPAEAVRVCVTHNHAGAQMEYDYYGLGQGARRAYVASLVDKGVGVAQEARRRARPARFAAGSGECRFAMNRRQRLPSGRVVTGADPVGPTDPQVQVCRFDAEDGSPLAAIFTYTAHPTTLGPGNRFLSPDYPGYAKQVFARITGATPLFMQGPAGNVGPGRDGFTADVAVHRRNGAMLACEAAKVFLSLDTRPGRLVFDRTVESGAPLGYFRRESGPQVEITIDTLTQEISLPVREHIPVREAEAIAAGAAGRLKALRDGRADDDQVAAATFEAKRAAMLVERCHMYHGLEQQTIEAHLLRIGDLVFAGVPLEPFVQIGLEVKRRSPYPATFFGGYTNGTLAYLPIAEAYAEGGYEVDTTPFAPEAAANAVAGTLAGIERLHARQLDMEGSSVR